MSEISKAADVNALLADFANGDAAGKLNVLGAGVAFLGKQPNGFTAPFTVVIAVSVPVRFAGSQYALTIELNDETNGRPAMVPNDQGASEPLRAQQIVSVAPLQPQPGLVLPTDAFSTNNVVMTFLNGLPLSEGHTYDFHVLIDGNPVKSLRFHFLKPDPGPIFGGPDGPGTIPEVPNPFQRPS